MITVITTTKKSTDEAKRVSKLLRHIIPNAKYIPRGRKNISDIINQSQDIDAEHIIIISSKQGVSNQMNFYEFINGGFEQDELFIRIFEYIDPKIFNHKKINHRGPLSTSNAVRSEDPELIDLLQKYWKIDLNNKKKLWMMLDKKEYSSYISIMDSTSMQRLAMLKIQVRKRS